MNVRFIYGISENDLTWQMSEIDTLPFSTKAISESK